MGDVRALVVVSEPIHSDAMARLASEAEALLAPGWDEASLCSCLSEAEGLILRGLGQVTAAVLDAAPRLRIVARHGTGVDNVDLEAARQRGVVVTNTPDATTASVAEHALALLLAVARRVSLADRGLRAGDWAVRERCWGMDLDGCPLGVIGFGRIGQRVARACHLGLGMNVVYYDPAPALAPGIEAQALSFGEVLAAADVLTLHLPLTAATRGLIGRNELARMKDGAILINAARGPIVDEVALLEALQAGKLGGAGLDVFAQEPVRGTHPLAGLDNVVLTPHIASSTPGTMRRMALTAVEEVLAVLSGRQPRYRVV